MVCRVTTLVVMVIIPCEHCGTLGSKAKHHYDDCPVYLALPICEECGHRGHALSCKLDPDNCSECGHIIIGPNAWHYSNCSQYQGMRPPPKRMIYQTQSCSSSEHQTESCSRFEDDTTSTPYTPWVLDSNTSVY